MSAYLDLCDYVEAHGKIIELHKKLLKIRHPKEPSGNGGGSIYSFAIEDYNESLEEAAKKTLATIKGTL